MKAKTKPKKRTTKRKMVRKQDDYQLLVLLSALIGISALVVGSSVYANPDTNRVSATNNKAGVGLTIPANAVEVAPDVFSLGTATVDGKVVEGLMFIHRDENAKPDNPGGGRGNGGGNTTDSTCYAVLAKGAKWKTTEPWVMNAANVAGLDQATLFNNTSANIQKWEDASGANIMGTGLLTSNTLIADETSPDNVNEIYFGAIDEPGVIAVTITWGIFGGPPQNRELVEMDQIFDEVDFNWSLNGAAGAMDYDNISTHELGHGLGLGHPSDTCTEETMYRFASYGETKKRDLNAGDIAGISDLY